MSRNYDDERFLPWYRRPTPTWLELSAAARGVLVSVAMELGDKTGEVTLRRGLPTLSTLLRIPWDVLEPALGELIAKGKLAWDGSRFVLSDPEYADRKRPTSKDRVQKHREAKAARALSEVPSEPEGCVTPVTLPGIGNVSSSLLSSSLLKSDLRSDARDPPAGQVLERTAPLEPDARVVFDTIATNRPIGQEPEIAWTNFTGHFAGHHFPSREGVLGRWQKWVSQQAVFSAKERERDRKREDQEAARKRFVRDGPERPRETPAQAAAFTQDLLARVRAGKAAGT